ncbi:MAG: hypothetical protein OHK0047_28800 [Leptolyngbyaceae cyanobacterium]|uniref:hypothetical protein n=1 Tax=Leptodesmis sichuanensis TaxID=2906798 RepID=UPI001F33F13B|nr:hypothetical protein [Leptodesmis sichuanensis]UIE37242.1 hypothetical protein KIK02_20135 [Leptodesmis sichuanensis A121]
MAPSNRDSSPDPLRDAIAAAIRASQTIANHLRRTATVVDDMVAPQLYQFVEQGTETIGRVVTPFAENPIVKFATKVPVLNWLMAAMGQVDVARVQQDVDKLRRQYPAETEEQLAHRVMVDTSWKAAGIGLATNLIPPLALSLFAVDIGAIAVLQAEMLYRIAAIYGFSPTDSTRRGEVLALWGLSTGSSGLMKSGLSILEVIPAVGTAIGVSSDAGLLYGLGHLACRFYEEKRKAIARNQSG